MQETIRARVDSKLKKQFEFTAKKHGQNVNQLLRSFMTDYVDKDKKQQTRHEETLQALESIAAGRCIAGDEVFAWLDTWGTDPASSVLRDAPKCK